MFSAFSWVKPCLSSCFTHADVQLPLIFILFLWVSLEHKSEQLQPVPSPLKCSGPQRLECFFLRVYLGRGREFGVKGWMGWGERAAAGLS